MSITKVKTASHEEWKELRSHYIGGSDAAAVVGLNAFSSPYALWAEKTAFGAIVHGPAGQCFDWVCWGVQRGFEGVYADVSDAKYPEEENRGAALLDAAETEAAVSLPLTIEEAS